MRSRVLSEDDAYALAEYLLSFQDAADVEKRTADAKAFAEERDFGGGHAGDGAGQNRGHATWPRVRRPL